MHYLLRGYHSSRPAFKAMVKSGEAFLNPLGYRSEVSGLEGVKATVLDLAFSKAFQRGLNFANLTCQLVIYTTI